MVCLNIITHRAQGRFKKFRCMSNLHWAAHFNAIELIRTELPESSDINMVDVSGNTPLHLACSEVIDADCIRILLTCHPDLNAQNDLLETPLNLFTRNSFVDDSLLSLLMEMGADPNIADANGDTPLHLAVGNGAIGSIRILLNKGASLFKKNKSNSSPMDLAYNDRDNNPEVFSEIAKFAIILSISRVHIEEVILDEIQKNEILQTFNEQCNEELMRLKNIYIGTTNITLYVILQSSKHAFAKYLKNVEILRWFKNFESEPYEIFGCRMIQHFEEALQRKEAEEFGYPIIRKKFHSLPEICVQNIIEYLRNEDLWNLSIIR